MIYDAHNPSEPVSAMADALNAFVERLDFGLARSALDQEKLRAAWALAFAKVSAVDREAVQA